MTTSVSVKSILVRLRERDPSGELERMARRIASVHQVSLVEMFANSREDDATAARHAFWSVLHQTGRWSYARIGKVLSRDHSTVMSGIGRHCARNGFPPPPKTKGRAYQPPEEMLI